RADRIAIAARSNQSQLEVVHPRKLVREKVRSIVEVVGDDLEPAIAVEVRSRRAARAPSRFPAGDHFFLVVAARWRLYAKRTSALGERAIAVVHHQLIRPVIKRVAHSGGDERVFVAIVVEIAGGDAPRPEGFHSCPDGWLRELAVSQVSVESVAEEQRIVVFTMHGIGSAFVL